MAKKYDVIALGELLIDFTMNGQSEQGNNMFEACPGGAPCNVLALLNKMGKIYRKSWKRSVRSVIKRYDYGSRNRCLQSDG